MVVQNVAVRIKGVFLGGGSETRYAALLGTPKVK